MAGKGKKKKKKRKIAPTADTRLSASSGDADKTKTDKPENSEPEFKPTTVESEPANMAPEEEAPEVDDLRQSDPADVVRKAATGLAAAAVSTVGEDPPKKGSKQKKGRARRPQGLSHDPNLPDPANANTKGPLIFLMVIFGLMAGMIALQFLEQ